MTKQVVWTLVSRILLIAAGFVSSIITARFLGPDGRGVFFYWTTLAALAVQFGNLGLHSSNTYLLTKGRANLSELATNSFWVSLVAGTILSIVAVVYLYLSAGLSSDTLEFFLPTALLIPTGLYFLFGTNLLLADDRIGEYNLFELANRYIALAAMLFAAWHWRTPQAFLLTMSIFALAICLLLFNRLRNIGSAYRFSSQLFRDGFAYSVRAYLATTLGFIVLRANVFILNHYVGSAELGVWSIAMQILDVFIVIPSTVALVLLPKIMRSQQSYRLMSSQIGVVAAMMLAACMIILLFGKQIISHMYGEEFEQAYTMILWGLPGVFSLGLTSIISQYLASEGIPFALVWLWLAGVLLELAIAFWLIPTWGGVGAMLSLSAVYIVILGGVWFLAINHYSMQRGKTNAE